ncbi:tetratricopeptide repeat protein [Paraburkholderia sediminicola]|uniref:Tetratricopeptide repeat protein n=1 Tax=Paraburkholderia rhynchosiae TaxID=487049 RepID=A0ACC7N550_9BURK
MNVKTSDDCIGVHANHPLSNQFVVIGYKDGAVSAIPKDLFRNGRDEAVEVDSLQIGRCSMLGAGSIVKCGEGVQRLVIGKHVAGGLRLRFLLSDPQSTHTLCAVPFGPPGFGIDDAPAPNYPDTVIHHDVSIGDEAMVLGGSVIASGCVIGVRSIVPPHFRGEPFGIYEGSPARLTGFRFSESVREKLLQLAWWDMPLDWLKQHRKAFLIDLAADEGRALDVLAELQQAKDDAMRATHPAAGPVADAPQPNSNAGEVSYAAPAAQLDAPGIVDPASAAGATPADALTADEAEALVNEFVATLNALSTLGQHQQAEAVARQMTAIFPTLGFGWKALGEALLQQGLADQALAPLQRASELSPSDHAAASPKAPHPEATSTPAQAPGASETAETVVTPRARKQAAAAPQMAETKRLATLFNSGRMAEAAVFAQGVANRYPRHPLGWKMLGLALRAQGQAGEATDQLRKAIELAPEDHEVMLVLAELLKEQGRVAEAEQAYRRLIALKPDHALAHNMLGQTLYWQFRLDEAEAVFRRTLEFAPGNARTLNDLGLMLQLQGRLAEAEDAFHRALAIDPDYDTARSNLLFCLSHSDDVDPDDLTKQHCAFGECLERKLRAQCKRHTNSRNPQRSLRVGFVSGDLFEHAVASFLEPLLVHLARDPGLTLYAYYNHSIVDDVSARLRSHFHNWASVYRMSDTALAEQIRADGIDILIDLSGHTGRNRLRTFARKPAPIQASWLGYPATTGMTTIDYYFADPLFVPPGESERQFSEKIVYLPAVAPFAPSETAPAVNTLPALANRYITFGSFNRLNKLRPAVIGLWAEVLHAVPTARMLVGGLPDEARNMVAEMFAQHRIERDRLVFRARSNLQVYLEQHREVDLCLDTFPYGGGTTTLNAAWMGVPTLTLPGRTAPARQGATIMSGLGLEAFIASDPADFFAKGVHWANDPAQLAELRNGMRERCAASAYFQPEVVVAAMSRALRLMWERWCTGEAPVSFDAQLPADWQQPVAAGA